MNCIGHKFLNNSDTLFRLNLFIKEIKFPNTPETKEDIKLYKFKLSYRLSTFLSSDSKKALQRISWIEEITNEEAILQFDNKTSIQRRIMSLRTLLLRHNLKIAEINLEQVFYSDHNYDSFEFSMPPSRWRKITYEEIKELITRDVLSA